MRHISDAEQQAMKHDQLKKRLRKQRKETLVLVLAEVVIAGEMTLGREGGSLIFDLIRILDLIDIQIANEDENKS